MIPQRILNKIELVTESGCWVWTASENGHGYGQTTLGGHKLAAHRLFYQVFKGPIPSGLVVDHLCRVRCCVNTDHLRLVTNKENLLCGETLPAIQLRRSTCKRGHRYEGYTRNDNSRHCKICRNELQKVKYHERKLAALAKQGGKK